MQSLPHFNARRRKTTTTTAISANHKNHKTMKTSKTKRTQGPPYKAGQSPEERAAGKAAIDRICQEMLRPITEYSANMERIKAMYEAGHAQHAKNIKPS